MWAEIVKIVNRRTPTRCRHKQVERFRFRYLRFVHLLCSPFSPVFFASFFSFVPPLQTAESQINVPMESKAVSIFKAAENVNKALAAAEDAGLHVVNIGAGDIIAGRSASILGLSCQLIRAHLSAPSHLEV